MSLETVKELNGGLIRQLIEAIEQIQRMPNIDLVIGDPSYRDFLELDAETRQT